MDAETHDLIEAALGPERGVTGNEQAAALLIQAGIEIASQAENARDCRRRFADGDKLFERTLKRQMKALKHQGKGRRSDDAGIVPVQDKITEQWVADQAGRLTYIQLNTRDRAGAAYWAQRRATANAVTTDARSIELMGELLEQFDWIDAHRFGGRTASRAWLLVQHADDDPAFQKLALERMTEYLEDGGVQKRDYAYLWDRVAVNTGQLQRYGTQPIDACNPDGTLDLKPVEAPETLDARRAAMGMGPAEIDLAQMTAERCGLK